MIPKKWLLKSGLNFFVYPIIYVQMSVKYKTAPFVHICGTRFAFCSDMPNADYAEKTLEPLKNFNAVLLSLKSGICSQLSIINDHPVPKWHVAYYNYKIFVCISLQRECPGEDIFVGHL